jgi:transposase
MVKVYQVPERTIQGLLAHERETGTMGVDTSRNGRQPAVDDAGLAKMKKIIEDQPDIPLEEIKEKTGLSICISAICRM